MLIRTDGGGASSGEEEADAALDAEMTERLNFGGGFVRKSGAEADHHRSKKEVSTRSQAVKIRGRI